MTDARETYPIMSRTASVGFDASEGTWLRDEIDDAFAELDELRAANERLRTTLYGTDDLLQIDARGTSRR